MRTCAKCMGSGTDSKGNTCSACDGSGKYIKMGAVTGCVCLGIVSSLLAVLPVK